MAKGDLRLSEKHGVNPMMLVCYVCGENTGEIALLGMLPEDKEAPRRGTLTKEPCDECCKWMDKGVILISTRNGEAGVDNPYRTGCWCVVKDDAVSRMLSNATLLKEILEKRVAFIEDEVWDKLGLPRINTREL